MSLFGYDINDVNRKKRVRSLSAGLSLVITNFCLTTFAYTLYSADLATLPDYFVGINFYLVPQGLYES